MKDFGISNINSNVTASITATSDKEIAKNIIDILFVVVDTNIRNNKEISDFFKNIYTKSLPGVSNNAKNAIDKMNQVAIKKLLDDIQNQLKTRK